MKISSYSIASSPALADKLIGTKVGGPVVDGTFNFTIQQLSDLILAPVNLQKVLDTGNTATQSINLNGNITVNGLTAVLGTMGTLQAGVINSSDSINSLGTLSLRATNALSFRTTSNLPRWTLDRVDSESSGNQGSNLSLSRYNDAGGFLYNVFTIDRATGIIRIASDITIGELQIGNGAGFGDGIIHGQGDEVIATWDLGGTNNYLYGNQQLVVRNGNTLLGYGNSSITSSDRLQVNGNGYFSKNGGATITINSEAFGNSKLTLLSNSSGSKKAFIDAPLALGTLVFQTQSTDRMLIDANGSLLINKSTSISSEYKLQVQGNVSILGYLQTNSIGTSEVFMSDLYISGDYGIGLGMGIFSSIGDQIIASWDYQDSNDYIYGNGILRINGNSNIVNINGLPTSSAGLLSGDLWRNGTVVNIVP